jgi:hypothetical protein
MMRAAALALCAVLAGPAGAQCRQALAIGLDVSASVDRREFALQAGGLALALEDPEIREAMISAADRPFMLSVFDWSGSQDQRLVIPWTAITGPGVLDDIALRLRAMPGPRGSRMTAVGAAMAFGDRLLAEQGDCERLTLDLAGDGMSNAGLPPRKVILGMSGKTITINALVIGAPGASGAAAMDPSLADLSGWYAAQVIRGPGAFVEEAHGFDGFAKAMRRKILREISGLFASNAPTDLIPAGDTPAGKPTSG